MLDRLELLVLMLDTLDALVLMLLTELELTLDTLLDELLPEVEMLDTLDKLLLDNCSIDRRASRSWLLGPGNCSSPVWKFSTSGTLTNPPSR